MDGDAERLAGWRGCHGRRVNGVVVKRRLKIGLETGVAVEMGGEVVPHGIGDDLGCSWLAVILWAGVSDV